MYRENNNEKQQRKTIHLKDDCRRSARERKKKKIKKSDHKNGSKIRNETKEYPSVDNSGFLPLDISSDFFFLPFNFRSFYQTKTLFLLQPQTHARTLKLQRFNRKTLGLISVFLTVRYPDQEQPPTRCQATYSLFL